jgi:hypothetical protein
MAALSSLAIDCVEKLKVPAPSPLKRVSFYFLELPISILISLSAGVAYQHG